MYIDDLLQQPDLDCSAWTVYTVDMFTYRLEAKGKENKRQIATFSFWWDFSYLWFPKHSLLYVNLDSNSALSAIVARHWLDNIGILELQTSHLSYSSQSGENERDHAIKYAIFLVDHIF